MQQQNTSSDGILHDVSRIVGKTNVSGVRIIDTARNSPIRLMHVKDASKLLQLAIVSISNMYGNRKNIEDTVLVEVTEMILNDFKELSIGEPVGELPNYSFRNSDLVLAFRMYAQGKFPKVNAEPYGGEVNALIWGKVLTAYRDERRKVVFNLKQREEKEQVQNLKDAETQKKNEEAKAYAIDKIKKASAPGEIEPIFWHVLKGYISLKVGEGKEILETAKKYIIDSDKKHIESYSKIKDSTIEKLKQQQKDTLLERSKVYARQITMFKYYK